MDDAVRAAADAAAADSAKRSETDASLQRAGALSLRASRELIAEFLEHARKLAPPLPIGFKRVEIRHKDSAWFKPRHHESWTYSGIDGYYVETGQQFGIAISIDGRTIPVCSYFANEGTDGVRSLRGLDGPGIVITDARLEFVDWAQVLHLVQENVPYRTQGGNGASATGVPTTYGGPLDAELGKALYVLGYKPT